MPSIVSSADEEELKSLPSLQAFAEAHLTRTKGNGNPYACPWCNSGNHDHAGSDSAFGLFTDSNGNGRFKCASCGAKGNIFDLAAHIWNLPNNGRADYPALLEQVARWRGMVTNATAAAKKGSNSASNTKKPVPLTSNQNKQGLPVEEEARSDQGNPAARSHERAYIAECQKFIRDNPHSEAMEYLASRAIPLSFAIKAGFGFDPKKHRLVIPWKGSDCYHADRQTMPNDNYPKYMFPKREAVGAKPLYNEPALNNEGVVIICEGAMDAIACELLGFDNAVALGGCSWNSLYGKVAALEPLERPFLLLALDRDKPGQKQQEELLAKLEEGGFGAAAVSFPETLSGKDMDEMRRSDSKALRTVLSAEVEKAREVLRTTRKEALEAALEGAGAYTPFRAVERIANNDRKAEPVPTGFAKLDEALGGGLPNGLTTLGAVSSMGKTTLAVQMADQIAASGRSVLFVSIEQSTEELVAKSLSRMSFEREGCDIYSASASEITMPSVRDTWSAAKEEHLLCCIDNYRSRIEPNMRYLWSFDRPSVAVIAKTVRLMARYSGKPPVVFIDYLQLLESPNERYTEKQATDANITALRKLAGELVTPVVCISSLNRASYSGEIKLDSFKESGGIEYGSDVVLALQPAHIARKLEGMDEKKGKAEASKLMRQLKGSPTREVELVILKNRNGFTPAEGLPFIYSARCNHMAEGSLDIEPMNTIVSDALLII